MVLVTIVRQVARRRTLVSEEMKEEMTEKDLDIRTIVGVRRGNKIGRREKSAIGVIAQMIVQMTAAVESAILMSGSQGMRHLLAKRNPTQLGILVKRANIEVSSCC